jgi:predicted enzyme related to lactoylglutathione lyase
MNTNTAGRFVWRELITPAIESSLSFYGPLFGWTPEASEMGPGMTYTVYKLGETQVAGMMKPMMEGTPPFWLDYITVDDVDTSRTRAVALGGTALTEAMDIPGIGRFAVVQDPTGATFALFRSLTPGASPGGAPADGTFCWSQLMTTDIDRAVPFYTALFGWEAKVSGDTILLARDGTTVSTAMASPTGVPSHWVPYVAVQDCDVVASKAAELGGRVLVSPRTLPGMGRFAVLADPGGAVVALWKDLGARSA